MPRTLKFCLLVLLPILPLSALAEVPGAHIQVTGIGEVETVPDMATFRVGVNERGFDIEALMNTVDKHTRDLLARVKELGVPAKDVTAAQVHIRPQYEWNDGKRHFKGYVVGREVVVILRDLALYGKLIDDIIQAGANELSAIELGSSRREELQDEALRKAIRHGRAEAELMAETAGTAIQRLWRATALGQGGPILMRSMAMESAADQSPVFEPGTISVRREVELIYLIK